MSAYASAVNVDDLSTELFESLDFLDKEALATESCLKRFDEERKSLKEIHSKCASHDLTSATGAELKSELEIAKRETRAAKDEADKSVSKLKSNIQQMSSRSGVAPGSLIASLQVYHNKRENDKLLNLLRASQTLDLCFVIDATGSMNMDNVFVALKENIRGVLKTIGELNPHLKFQLGFVAYRDPEDSQHIESLPFTTSRTEFEDRIKNVKCTGGGDECEDVIGALKLASDFNWTFANKLLFLCGDAPCHGIEYHGGRSNDNHPAGLGIPSSRAIRRLVENKVQVYFWKINDTTNQMIAKFNEEADATGLPFPDGRSRGEFIVSTPIDIHSKESATRYLKESITRSISSSMSMSSAKAGSFKPKKIDNALKTLATLTETEENDDCSIDSSKAASGGGEI